MSVSVSAPWNASLTKDAGQCLVSLSLFAMFLGALVHLLEEELVGAGEVLLERLAGGERVSRVEVEVAGVEVGRSWQTEFQTLNLRLNHDNTTTYAQCRLPMYESPLLFTLIYPLFFQLKRHLFCQSFPGFCY